MPLLVSCSSPRIKLEDKNVLLKISMQLCNVTKPMCQSNLQMVFPVFIVHHVDIGALVNNQRPYIATMKRPLLLDNELEPS